MFKYFLLPVINMEKQTRKKRAVDALKKLILFSAVIHLIILVVYAVWYADAAKVNYFNILEIKLLFPSFFIGQIISILVMVVIYAAIYCYFTRR
jgi:polyferredoxin